MNIRQVQFSGNLVTKDLSPRDAWRVTFTLAEYLSVSEKAEQRQTTGLIQEQQGEGAATVSAAEAEALTGFETFLGKLDQALA